MTIPVRAFHVVREEILADAGAPAQTPLVRVAVAAIVANPWFGRWVPDLSPEVQQLCPPLAQAMMRRGLASLDGAPVEAFGKAVVVGTGGEIEHGDALVHNPFFSDVVRYAVGGTSVIASTETRGAPGTAIAVPLCHITAATTRSHYQGMTVRVDDAPNPDEVLVIVALSTGGRTHSRIGDRRTDPPFDASAWAP